MKKQLFLFPLLLLTIAVFAQKEAENRDSLIFSIENYVFNKQLDSAVMLLSHIEEKSNRLNILEKIAINKAVSYSDYFEFISIAGNNGSNNILGERLQLSE